MLSQDSRTPISTRLGQRYTDRMHANIDKILRRAGALIVQAWHNPDTSEDRKEMLALAYGKIHPGRKLAKQPPANRSHPDPDGSETLAAARFVAEAMGLKVLGHREIDEGQEIGSGHLVVLRDIEGHPDPRHEFRCQAARAAGMCVQIHCEGSDLVAALANRRKSNIPSTRQPSLF